MTSTTSQKPPDDLAQALVRARELRPRLAAATDELNKTIEEAERAIAALKLGVRASVEMYSDRMTLWYQSLVFGKEDKTWRLLIESGYESQEETNVTPLINGSRDLRLRALELLPKLVMNLTRAAEYEIERVEQSTAEAKKFIANISREGAK